MQIYDNSSDLDFDLVKVIKKMVFILLYKMAAIQEAAKPTNISTLTVLSLFITNASYNYDLVALVITDQSSLGLD